MLTTLAVSGHRSLRDLRLQLDHLNLITGPNGSGKAGDELVLTTHVLSGFDSMMTHCADPRHTPEALMLREHMRGWRFYDHFRTDTLAPARMPQTRYVTCSGSPRS